MPAAATTTQGTTSYRYHLYVNGKDIIDKVSLELAPLKLSMAGPGGGMSQLTWAVLDPTGVVALPHGAKVRLNDSTSSTGLRFSGVLLQQERARVPGSTGKVVECTAVGHEWTMSTRQITTYKSRDKNNQLLSKDDLIVKALCDDAGCSWMYDGGFVQRTSTDVDLVGIYLSGQSLAEALDELADIVQPETSYHVRRWYVDPDEQIHWYSGSEDLLAPFRVADGSYVEDVLAASGVVSFWTGRPKSAAVLQDATTYANATINGTYTTGWSDPPVASLCLNEPQHPAVDLDGSTGYVSATGANLHPGDTWTVGITFNRDGGVGSQQALWSGGTNDILIGFDASNHIRVQKEGTGDNFVSDDTFGSTTLTYNLVVARSPGSTIVYVNGAAITGTSTARTFSAAAGAINIGRKLSTTDQFFNGAFWGAFISSSKLSATTVANLYNQWVSVTPDDLTASYDASPVRKRVYVKGAHATQPDPGSGWSDGQALPPEDLASFESFGRKPEAFIDRPDSTTKVKRKRYANAFLTNNNSPIFSTTFSVTLDPSVIRIAGASTSPQPGQRMYVTDDALGLSAESTEIKQVETDLNLGSGVVTFDVTTGALPYSANRGRRRR